VWTSGPLRRDTRLCRRPPGGKDSGFDAVGPAGSEEVVTMLSEGEQLRLAAIERQLGKDAPRLAGMLADFGRHLRNRRLALAAASCCLGLVALITGANDVATVLVGLALVALGVFDIATELRRRRTVASVSEGSRRPE
jgi:Protein of unknown function (DUF3040)